MKVSDGQFEKLLGLTSVQELKSTMASRKLRPTLAQAAKLALHCNSLIDADGGAPPSLRLGVIHTYTSELLDPWLNYSAALEGLSFETYHAPYGVTVQEAMPGSGLAAHNPDVTLLLLRREDLHPALVSPVSCIAEDDRSAVSAELCSSLQSLVSQLRSTVAGQIIVTLMPQMTSPGLGLYDPMAQHSETQWWETTKIALTADLRENFSGVSYLDLDQLLMRVGSDSFFDDRLWYSSMFPFSPEGAQALTGAVASIAASTRFTKAKVIVLDADNTLWGGVIGEDGMHGIALGPDYPGRAFVDFQKRILEFQQRGFILALCSKNNPEDVAEVFRDHPHQLLKDEHFAAQRVNWTPKPENIASMAKELNLGLDSFIFVDDSDYECSAVRHSLKEVLVVQVPKRATEVPSCLDALSRLEITSLTKEDLEKTAMYAQERQRQSQLEQLSAGEGSIDDYLESLKMHMTIGLNDRSVVPRLAQLTQKTNQFNLTTRRYSEQDVTDKIDDAGTAVYHFSLADSFGDSGIVGLAIVEGRGSERPVLDTFLMSCRVIGRKAEQAFLSYIVDDLGKEGAQHLAAQYLPTRKNVLVEKFLPDFGFLHEDGDSYVYTLQNHSEGEAPSFPITIEGPS